MAIPETTLEIMVLGYKKKPFEGIVLLPQAIKEEGRAIQKELCFNDPVDFGQFYVVYHRDGYAQQVIVSGTLLTETAQHCTDTYIQLSVRLERRPDETEGETLRRRQLMSLLLKKGYAPAHPEPVSISCFANGM